MANTKVYIKWLTTMAPDHIVLPAAFKDALPLVQKVHIGSWNQEVRVVSDLELPPNTVGLSASIPTSLKIPDTIPYELSVRGSDLYLGPVIAIIAVRENKPSKTALEACRGYVLNYESISGLVYVCSIHGINRKNKSVSGYYFDPNANDSGGGWKKGSFPYPDAIYRRFSNKSNANYHDLISHAGFKVFNPYIFNKRELWECFRRDSQLHRHLPKTRLLGSSSKALDQMLAAYGAVYLKPVRGSMGEGIHLIKKTRNGYLFINRRRKKLFAASQKEAMALLKSIAKGRAYLIQQPVIFTHKGKHLDFRVVMQKDSRQTWICSGIIARFGHKQSIYTNDISHICSGSQALAEAFHLNSGEADTVEQELVRVCTLACEKIDQQFGAFGDVGIDAVIDSDHNIWILEINGLHRHILAAYVEEDPQMYRTVLTRPLEFAKAIAGFQVEKKR